METNVTQDFIFGTMATDELRLAAIVVEGRGVYHGNRIDPPDPEPGMPVEITASMGTAVDAAAVDVYFTLDGTDPQPDSAHVSLGRGEVVWDTLLWGYRQIWHGQLPAQPAGTHVRYRIAALNLAGERIWAEPDAVTGRPATFAYHVDRERVPAWIRDAVIYHIFVDRFNPGGGRAWNSAPTLNDFWGGTLQGVTEKLPYLQALGVNCLWLSPIFPSPSHHGYDATDFLRVEPRLGTEADLRELIDAAHSRSMRVLLDFVPNHVSNEHPAFRTAATDPTASERGWFTFDAWPDGYRSFFGVKTLPQLDNEHLPTRRYVIDAARHWLAAGADGFRLDYANGPSHGFWTQFRAETRQLKPESFTVGEIIETAELQRSYQGRLDGVLDFLLLQHMRAFFAFDTIGAPGFDSFLQRHLAYFPDDFVLPSFLDNHDMNRFPWIVRGDARRLKLAALCQFTLPYPPIIYYGTEAGLSQWHDLEYPDGSRKMEESRTPMLWGAEQDEDLLRFYAALGALRRKHAALWRGQRSTLVANDAGVYIVALDDGRSQAVVALNRSVALHTIALPGPGLELVLDTVGTGTLSNQDLRLPPMSGALLVSGS